MDCEQEVFRLSKGRLEYENDISWHVTAVSTPLSVGSAPILPAHQAIKIASSTRVLQK